MIYCRECKKIYFTYDITLECKAIIKRTIHQVPYDYKVLRDKVTNVSNVTDAKYLCPSRKEHKLSFINAIEIDITYLIEIRHNKDFLDLTLCTPAQLIKIHDFLEKVI